MEKKRLSVTETTGSALPLRQASVASTTSTQKPSHVHLEVSEADEQAYRRGIEADRKRLLSKARRRSLGDEGKKRRKRSRSRSRSRSKSRSRSPNNWKSADASSHHHYHHHNRRRNSDSTSKQTLHHKYHRHHRSSSPPSPSSLEISRHRHHKKHKHKQPHSHAPDHGGDTPVRLSEFLTRKSDSDSEYKLNKRKEGN